MRKYIIAFIALSAFFYSGCSHDSELTTGNGQGASSDKPQGSSKDKNNHDNKADEADEADEADDNNDSEDGTINSDPDTQEKCADADLQTSTQHCGKCNNACGDGFECIKGKCECGGTPCGNACITKGECLCEPGTTETCYDGPEETMNVGECRSGIIECLFDPDIGSYWGGNCLNQVLPNYQYNCDPNNPLKDADCNGVADTQQDDDNDGYAICSTNSTALLDCCDNSNMCNTSLPEYVNRSKTVDCKGNGIDDDCDGEIDEDDVDCGSSSDSSGACTQTKESCSTASDFKNAAILSSPEVAMLLAKSMDICLDKVSESSDKAGIIEADVTSLSTSSYGYDDDFGFDDFYSGECASQNDKFKKIDIAQANVLENMKNSFGQALINPRGGNSFAILSSGIANDANHEMGGDYIFTKGGKLPDPYCTAHHHKVESHPSCDSANNINDSVRFHLKIKAPSTAKGFSFDFRFYSYEYPYYVCTSFNDFFLTLLTDESGKPLEGVNTDGNISYDKTGNPVSVNNAFFTSCTAPACFDSMALSSMSGTGCPASLGTCINGKCGTCEDGNEDVYAFTQTPYTGYNFALNGNRGGATAWLTTKAPVKPNQIFNLDFYIWDTGDQAYDSSVILDNFQWLCDETSVGTDFAPPIEGIN